MKEIIGFPGYTISCCGNVVNKHGKEIKSWDKNGYVVTRITQHNLSIHRLVAEAFIPNPLNLPEVNHIDGIKTHNYPWNLEWSTSSHNSQHAYDNGLRQPTKGILNGQAKLTEQQVQEIRAKYIPRKYTQLMLAKEYGVCELTIQEIILFKSWN